MEKDVHLPFTDYKKAFDQVKYDTFMEHLKSLGIEGNDIWLLSDLRKEQIAAILRRLDFKCKLQENVGSGEEQ